MSEEKLYVVKNAKGLYLSFSDDKLYRWREGQIAATTSQRIAHDLCTEHGGHVVTLIEVPEKVVISKTNALRQGWLVARYDRYNPDAVSDILARYKDEAWDMIEAYVNGYTVAKEKKYLVYKVLGGKQKNKHEQVAQAYRSNLFFDTIIWLIKEHKIMSSDTSDQFTEAEIEHYDLQDCEKEEVTDDDD